MRSGTLADSESVQEENLASSKRALKPSTYQRSRWDFAGGKAFDDVLAGTDGAIRLVDAHWLVDLSSSSDRVAGLQMRQRLPQEAFVTLDELKMFGCPDAQLLPVVLVSYPWLTPQHPDPHGTHILRLAAGLRALTNEPASVSATLTGPSGTQR